MNIIDMGFFVFFARVMCNNGGARKLTRDLSRPPETMRCPAVPPGTSVQLRARKRAVR
jgi:hypothetical protein